MRRRLLAALVGMTVLVVLLLGVPRGFIIAERARDQEQAEVDQIATSVALLMDSSSDDRSVPPSIERLLGPSDQATISVSGGPPAIVGVAETDRSVVSPVMGMGDVTVEVARDSSAVRRSVIEALASLVALCVGVLVVAGYLAAFLARQLARPLTELAEAAARLGDGSFDLPLPATSIPEAAAVTAALGGSAERLREVIRREREFAANASHQLRTPLTGLRLRLEDMTLWPEVTDDVRAELEAGISDVDRLSETVSGLLAMARAGRYADGAAVCLVDTEVAEACRRWDSVARTHGRSVEVERDAEHAVAACPPGALAQILDVLIHNALEHGTGTVDVSVERDSSQVLIRVADEGPGIPRDALGRIFDRHAKGDASSGEGIGLPLARQIAEGFGGTLGAGPGPPTTFELSLPVTDERDGRS